MHVFAILGIQVSRRIQIMGLMIKQSSTERKVDSEIWGSLGSRQLLQLQHPPKIQNFLGPSLLFRFAQPLGFVLFLLKICFYASNVSRIVLILPCHRKCFRLLSRECS